LAGDSSLQEECGEFETLMVHLTLAIFAYICQNIVFMGKLFKTPTIKTFFKRSYRRKCNSILKNYVIDLPEDLLIASLFDTIPPDPVFPLQLVQHRHPHNVSRE
jgi:hypothetical protein